MMAGLTAVIKVGEGNALRAYHICWIGDDFGDSERICALRSAFSSWSATSCYDAGWNVYGWTWSHDVPLLR